MLNVFKQLKQSKSVQLGREFLEMMKNPERTQRILEREEQLLADLKVRLESTKPKYEIKEVYLEGKDVVPPYYQTEEWLEARGFKAKKPRVAVLKTLNCKTVPLYDTHFAIKKVPGADLSFRGKVYSEAAAIPFKYQPLDYFIRHQLTPKMYPGAKLFVDQRFYVDYYQIPIKLNASQRKELVQTYPLNFEGDLYVCNWSELPKELKRAKELRDLNLPIPKQPTAYLFMGGRYTPLYALAQPTSSEKVQEMEHLSLTKEEEMATLTFEEAPLKKGEWLEHPEQYVMLDTETTGLKATDEIIQLAMVNLKGEVLYQQYFKPSVASSPEAYQVHKISDRFLKTQPLWQECWDEIESILKDKTILIQNAAFDIKMFKQTCAKYQLSSAHTFQVKDTMKYFYEQFKVKSLKKVMLHLQIEHEDQKLHDALEDCLKCIEVLNKSIAN